MQKKGYSSPDIELLELKLCDTILNSVPFVQPTEDYILPVFGRRPSMDEEIQGDDLYEKFDD